MCPDSEIGCPDLDNPSLDDDLTPRDTPTGPAVPAAAGAQDRTDAALLRLYRITTAATIRAGNAGAPAITPTQIRVLTLLAAAPDGLSLGTVASCLTSTASATSRVCARLVDDQLIHRGAAPGSAIRLSITADGAQLLATVNRDRLRRLRALLESLPPSDCARVQAALETLATAPTPTGQPDTDPFW